MRRTLALLAAVAALLIAAPAALAAPAVSVSDSVEPPTAAFNVSGTGFGATEVVDVYFDRTDLARVVTNTNGGFSATRVSVPAAAAPGAHSVIALGERSGLAGVRAFAVRTDWPQQGRTGAHQNFNPYDNVI